MLKMLQLKLQMNQLLGFIRILVSNSIRKSILPRDMCIFEVQQTLLFVDARLIAFNRHAKFYK